jgi:hypothetical protein
MGRIEERLEELGLTLRDIAELWGDAGHQARSAPGQGLSPLNVTIIVDAVVPVAGD